MYVARSLAEYAVLEHRLLTGVWHLPVIPLTNRTCPSAGSPCDPLCERQAQKQDVHPLVFRTTRRTCVAQERKRRATGCVK